MVTKPAARVTCTAFRAPGWLLSTVLERVHPATGATALHHACLSVIDGGGASAARAVAPSAALAAVAALLEAGAAGSRGVRLCSQGWVGCAKKTISGDGRE